MAASAEKLPVLIAGAGPVGLIAALGLAQRGVPVIVLEAEAGLYQDPRAATTHPATLEMLDDLGLLAEVERQGLVCRHFRFWDRVTGDMVANFDLDLLRGDCRFPYVIQCEQFKTASIAYQALAALPGTEVRFSHRVTGVSQAADGLTVTVETPDGPAEIAGAYLIGADGGRSEVRKALAIEFEGFTYPEHFLVLTSPFDFAAHRDLVYRNYFFDPIEWCNLFKVAALGPPGLWRAVFPADPGRADADVLGDANAQATLKRFFPKDRELRDRPPQSLQDPPARRRRLPRPAGRRLSAPQQFHRRHGAQRRHPRRRQPGGKASFRLVGRGRGGIARSLRPPAQDHQ